MAPPPLVLTARRPFEDHVEEKLVLGMLKSARPLDDDALSLTVSRPPPVKATKTRPSGDHGCAARTPPPRTATAFPRAPTIQSLLLPEVHALTTKCVLPGCHATRGLHSPTGACRDGPTLCRPRPSMSTSYACALPPRSLKKATCFPSGEAAGSMSWYRLLLRSTRWPLGSRRQTS